MLRGLQMGITKSNAEILRTKARHDLQPQWPRAVYTKSTKPPFRASYTTNDSVVCQNNSGLGKNDHDEHQRASHIRPEKQRRRQRRWLQSLPHLGGVARPMPHTFASLSASAFRLAVPDGSTSSNKPTHTHTHEFGSNRTINKCEYKKIADLLECLCVAHPFKFAPSSVRDL